MRQGQRRSGFMNSAGPGRNEARYTGATLPIHVRERPKRSIVGVRDSVQYGAATWTRALFFLCSDRAYLELAKTAAEKALDLNPGLGTPYSVLAAFACTPVGHSCPEQEMILDQAIDADPKNPALYNFRGQFLLDSGYVAEATRDFQQCVDLDPARILCQAFLMVTRMQAGHLDEGLNMALDLADNPTASLHVIGAAAMLHAAGRQPDAQSLVNRVASPEFNPRLLAELLFSAEPASQETIDRAWQRESERMMVILQQEQVEAPPQMAYLFRQFDQLKGFDGFVVWQTFHPDFLQSPIRYQMFEHIGLPQFWRVRGFPDRCQPLTDVAPSERDYRCN